MTPEPCHAPPCRAPVACVLLRFCRERGVIGVKFVVTGKSFAADAKEVWRKHFEDSQ